MLELSLPYPPSANKAWRTYKGRMLISREGRLYRQRVRTLLAALALRPTPERLALSLDVYPPDRRRRDLDNVQKALLDALAIGGAYRDDSQIDLLITKRGPVKNGGDVHVRLDELPVARCPLCGGPWNHDAPDRR